MSQTDLLALSPIDGRYRAATDFLRPLLSESGLIRERIHIEAAWLLHLHAQRAQLGCLAGLQPAGLTAAVRAAATALLDPPESAAAMVKEIEGRTNHDVKAVEYYVRDQLLAAGATPAVLELVHFGCTSEDINNLAYARLLLRARQQMIAQGLRPVLAALEVLASSNAAVPMLARTHGQTASPTTLGKEFANVLLRLRRAEQRWRAVAILGKWNGAVGNYNAQHAVAPEVDWPALAAGFVSSQGLQFNSHTTQIEPHDWIGEYCDALAASGIVLIDFSRDVWGYISLGYLRQRPKSGEVGSSTMPHKVNPIDFENAEGNLGIANALLRHFADKLPISRWQRDLTDSTVLRNLGTSLGHVAVAWRALSRGLSRIDADPARLAADLQAAPEVLAEAIQTAMRAAGIPNGYELLKDLTRGQAIDLAQMRALIARLDLPAGLRQRLARLEPADYVGLAAQLAQSALGAKP